MNISIRIGTSAMLERGQKQQFLHSTIFIPICIHANSSASRSTQWKQNPGSFTKFSCRRLFRIYTCLIPF